MSRENVINTDETASQKIRDNSHFNYMANSPQLKIIK